MKGILFFLDSESRIYMVPTSRSLVGKHPFSPLSFLKDESSHLINARSASCCRNSPLFAKTASGIFLVIYYNSNFFLN